MACEDVARARWTGGLVVDERVSSRRGMPGRGWVVGKLRRWSAYCLETNSVRGMGSWAQAWKISAAWMGGKKWMIRHLITKGSEGGSIPLARDGLGVGL